MNLRPLHHALLIALFGVASVAVAQTSSTTTGSEPATTTTAPGAAHDATMSHAGKHRAMHARARGTNAGHESNGNPEYESALRRCVQMNGDERERCLDDAIAHHAS